jgi:hypothetical protein
VPHIPAEKTTKRLQASTILTSWEFIEIKQNLKDSKEEKEKRKLEEAAKIIH